MATSNYVPGKSPHGAPPQLRAYLESEFRAIQRALSTQSAYRPGDVRNYGGREGADISDALQAAIAENSEVFIPFASATAANVEIRAGVAIFGLGVYATTLGKASDDPIFTTSAAAAGAELARMTLDAADLHTDAVCYFAAGTADEFYGHDLRFIGFDNGTTSCAGFTWDSHASTRNVGITLERVHFDNAGGSVKANYQSVLIFNAYNVRVLFLRLVRSGAFVTATAGSFTGVTGDIQIVSPYIEGVDSSSILIRVNGAATLRNAHVVSPSFVDISPTLGKLCITFQQAPGTTGGTFENLSVSNPQARCPDPNCAGGVVFSFIGAARVNDCKLIGGELDFTDATGVPNVVGSGGTATEIAQRAQRGAWFFTDAPIATNVHFLGLTVRGSQSFACGISGAQSWSMVDCEAELCLANAASGEIGTESAFYVPQGPTSGGKMLGLTGYNCGNGGAGQAVCGCASSATIDGILVASCKALDDRGSPAMVFGYSFGALATGVRYSDNESTGHTSAAYNPAGSGVEAVTMTNSATLRTLDCSTATDADIADFLATMLADKRDLKAVNYSIS